MRSLIAFGTLIGITAAMPSDPFSWRADDRTRDILRDLVRLQNNKLEYPQNLRSVLSQTELADQPTYRDLDEPPEFPNARQREGAGELLSIYKPSTGESKRQGERIEDSFDDGDDLGDYAVSTLPENSRNKRHKFIFCHFLGLHMSGCLDTLVTMNKPETQTRSKKPDSSKEVPSMYLLGGAIGR
ncbi:hypothetical protein BaRGS_00031559 [Batillaria attramentaria]|uniref:Uncharacterized protein n=1 Tax=Batillaria attramentaria TaxID=370345 RepID=A0ABD0JRA7_9CAEN